MTDARPTPIILDCDPGVDDAIAIIMALGLPDAIHLRAITCVAGNVPLSSTARNARQILELAGRTDIPVHGGCTRPIMSPTGRTSSAHGTDGLGGVRLPEPALQLQPEHAADAIRRIARETPGGITLCAIGPLTNVALALLRDPALADHVRRIVLMGGACFGPGNITPLAEFNFYADPHAAQIVFDAGVPIVLFGLDVTRKALLSEGYSAALATSSDQRREAIGRMLGAYESRDPCLHDPCVIAWLADPDLFELIEAHVEISLADGVASGQSVTRVRDRHLEGRKPNCRVAVDVDNAALERMLSDCIAALDAPAGTVM
ncbi:nucleoside hydrolase [Primorskyibacter flagellatus]|uniref:Purine nucleosidase n=1 Tax=Primorskyibacter flagellatus TaxID=1387277 RepID=A0A1W2E873_9RHOB|nr:nucleoside hydrolase [Primorskyibacter flagellatus]SMD05980.1 purine nucleosidase [Primorskyibacter flagellatus]